MAVYNKEDVTVSLKESRELDSNDQDIDELLATSQTGNADNVAAFFERYRPRLLRMIEVRLNNQLRGRVDASDIIQDAYAEAARVLDDYLKERPLPVFLWLRRLAGQKLTEAYRKHVVSEKRTVRKEQNVEPMANINSESLAFEFADQNLTPSNEYSQKEVRERLHSALEQLSESDREILTLRHFEHLNGVETAQVLGITHDAVKKRYIRALSRLRKQIPEWKE